MHKVTRESDEYTCTCGLRWGIEEQDPHPPKMIGWDPAHAAGDVTVEVVVEVSGEVTHVSG